MADNLTTYDAVVDWISYVATGAGSNEFWYGVPSEINVKHNRDYPVFSVYPDNTSITNKDLQSETYQARTSFRCWIWYDYPDANSDNAGNQLQSRQSSAQDMAFDVIRRFMFESETKNGSFMFDNAGINLQFFEEQGTDRICGVSFTITISYYETCK